MVGWDGAKGSVEGDGLKKLNGMAARENPCT
jgi:hypothetical protein